MADQGLLTVYVDVPALAAMAQDKAEEVMEKAVTALGTFARDRVVQMANEKLSGPSAKKYVGALKVMHQKLQMEISLGDAEAIRLEASAPAVDLKPILLGGPKAKMGKKGPYVDVPFTHTRSLRDAGGKKNYIQSRAARGIVKVLVAEALSTGHRQTAFKGAWTPTSKKRRIADMRIKPHGSAGASLTTFRRISANSDPSSWMLKERQGLEIFSAVVKEVEAIKDQVISDIAAGTS